MFVKNKRYSRRKVVGGSLLGNLFDKSKKIVYNTGRRLLPKARKLTTHAINVAKPAIRDAIKKQVTAENVLSLGRDLASGDKTKIKRRLKTETKEFAKTLAKDKRLNRDVRQTIDQLTKNKDIKAVLANKSKDLLKSRQSRAILSNLIAGSGMQQY